MKHIFSVTGEAQTYSDVLIAPKYSEILSRTNVDLTSDFKDFKLNLPVFSANMKHVTGPSMANAMYKNGGMGILHRFNTIEGCVNQFNEAMDYITFPSCTSSTTQRKVRAQSIAVSIGVNENDKELFNELYKAGARIFCIDVAHGHHILVKNMIKYIKEQASDIHVIAGNIATPDGAQALEDWGADTIKVGIGPGNVCQTRKNTGVGIPQLYALEWMHHHKPVRGVNIIADGGITNPGDIAKALKYADAVMLGSMIAGTSETPGKVFRDENERFYKIYGGSASGETKVSNGQEGNFVEGITKKSEFKGHVKYILREIRDGLKSAFSYTGSKNLSEFQTNCDFIQITSGSRGESKI